jgi:hypothetical protein
MENLIAWLAMAAISLPLSFVIARGCLRGLVRLMSLGTGGAGSGEARRDVL